MSEAATTSRVLSAAGVAFLLVSALGWGLNFPITKYALAEWPLLSTRGLTGLGGGIALAMIALARHERLQIQPSLLPRLFVVSFFTITCWVAGMGFALLWLRASEAAIFAVTAPLWVSLLAWPVLGERPTLLRGLGLLIAFAGVVVLVGGNGLDASLDKLPGALCALGGALGVAIGTVAIKRRPLPLQPVALAAWQMVVGCIPVALLGVLIEHPDPAVLTAAGWGSLVYSTLVQFCICYACWFAALARMPASTASIGMLLVPVIGVVAAALMLREAITPTQVTALIATLGGVTLAMRF